MSRLALVTGGAGFIGGHLVSQLLQDGWRVRVLDDFSSGREENLADSAGRIELVRSDLSAPGVLPAACEGVHTVFHEAAIPSVPRSVSEPIRTHEVNATGTLKLLEAARRAGVDRVVYASSCASYGDGSELPKVETMAPDPRSPYAAQKLAGEQYCRLYADLYGLETVSLRYFNVYGPRQDPTSDYAAVVPRFVTAAIEGRPSTIFGDGEQTRDFVYVQDVVRANLLAAAAPGVAGAVVNVAGGRRISLNDLVARIAELTGCDEAPVHAPERVGDVRDSEADVALARERIGFEPETELRDGLAATVEHFRKLPEEGTTR